MKQENIGKLFDTGASIIAEDPEEGQYLISRALMFEPETYIGWYNLGLALHHQGKINEAIRAYDQAISLSDPPLEQAVNNIAQDLLLSGDWERGWICLNS